MQWSFILIGQFTTEQHSQVQNFQEGNLVLHYRSHHAATFYKRSHVE